MYDIICGSQHGGLSQDTQKRVEENERMSPPPFHGGEWLHNLPTICTGTSGILPSEPIFCVILSHFALFFGILCYSETISTEVCSLCILHFLETNIMSFLFFGAHIKKALQRKNKI